MVVEELERVHDATAARRVMPFAPHPPMAESLLMDPLDPSKLEPGDVLAGLYRIEELQGKGGFGAVYRATQLKLGRQVAIKVLHAELTSRVGLGRFWRETQLAQKLEHPNTVRLHDFGETEAGIPYIVFQFLRGRSLKTALHRDGPMSHSRAVRIMTQTLKSLMEAHEAGIVHRDIKPDNIFLTDFQGEPDFVKVLDFGVAKTVMAGVDVGSKLTVHGEMVGTPNYMAPEQVRTEPVSAATDTYALGLVLSEMLTGKQVFAGPSAISVCFAQSSDKPAPIPDEVLASPLGELVLKATQKDSARRFANAAEMLIDLDAIAQSIGSSGSGSYLTHSTIDERIEPSQVSDGSTPPLVPTIRSTATPRAADGMRASDLRSPVNRGRVVVAIIAIVLLALGLAAGGVATGAALFSSNDQGSNSSRPTRAESSGAEALSTPDLPRPSVGADNRQPPVNSRLAQLTPTQLELRLTSWGWMIVRRSNIGPSGGMRAVLLTIRNTTHSGGVWLYYFDDPSQTQLMTTSLGSGGRAVHASGHRILLVELRTNPASSIDSAASTALLTGLIH